MAFARLYLKHIQQRAHPSLTLIGNRSVSTSDGSRIQRFSTSAAVPQKASDDKSDKREISVLEGRGKSNVSRSKRRGQWNTGSLGPFRFADLLRPSGLQDALHRASENLNRLFGDLTPSRLLGQVRESDKCYRLRFEVPGLSNEELKITIEDGCLVIKGESQGGEEGEGSEEEEWYSYYATLVLPDDAKVDEIKANLKDGVLYLTIPKSEKQAKDVREVEIQ